jgi:PAS domain S-box-containing protein
MATILIVDDEPVILDVMQRFLAAADRTLVLAGSAREAIARGTGALEIDVALVDKNLGDGSGLEVARALRRAMPDVEVILVTGYASFDSAVEAIQIGAYDYLTKPITDYDALNLRVENAIEKVRLKRRQRELREQLVESEALHRGVFETASDAMLLLGATSGEVEDANPAAERLYGRDRAALRCLRWSDLLAVSEDRTLPRPGTRSLPSRHRRADGTPVPVELSSGELRLRDRARLVVSVRDVTERVAAERARRDLEENLRQAQKMEAVGRLAGGIAHDFANLLAVILGYSEMLRQDLPVADTRARESAEGIVEAATRAVGVTRQLLTLSRKKLLRPELLSLNQVVQDLGRLLSRAVGDRIALTTSLEDGLWPVMADVDHLAQVLLNLAVNARDAMADGGPLSISTANVELGAPIPELGLGAGRFVMLAVKDAGCGMTEEVRARVFEPFFTTKANGTGLGLATVHGIVRQGGGAVRIESRPGEGSTFTVFLPAAAEGAVCAPSASPSTPRGGGERIVLAEDDDALRLVLTRVLAGSGYEVLAARDGGEALETVRARGGRVDLLLADVVMPRVNGTELAAALAREQRGVKVIFMTGHADDATLLDALGGSGAEIIEKPFTTEALLGRIRGVLGPQVRSSEAAPAGPPRAARGAP